MLGKCFLHAKRDKVPVDTCRSTCGERLFATERVPSSGCARPSHGGTIRSGAAGLARFFDKIDKDRANLRIVIHRIVAIDDYVWAHVHFINLFNDNPQDVGLPALTFSRIDADGKATEHWDVLQEIGDPKNAAHANGMF